jgi:2'-5' RNA ligase
MRLFVAVELSSEARLVAERTAAELKRALANNITANWVAAENMHLTVRFIGHVPDDRAPALLDALSPPVELAPFDVELTGCGRFPPRGQPRVIWIGVTRGLPSLAALHAEFDRRVLPFGYEPETRPFSAHLTLARITGAPRGQTIAIDAALRAMNPGPVAFRVDHATVLESRLSPKGPTYHVRMRVDLKASC